MDVAKAQLDEALYSSGLRTQEQVRRLVEESQVRHGASNGAPGTSARGSTKREASTVDKKAEEIWAFLEGLRGVSQREGAADVSGGSGPHEWKVCMQALWCKHGLKGVYTSRDLARRIPTYVRLKVMPWIVSNVQCCWG